MQQMFFSDDQLAERYQVYRSTIWRWAASGDLPQPVKLSAGTTRWRKEDIEAHDAQKQQPEEKQPAAEPAADQEAGSRATRASRSRPAKARRRRRAAR